MSWNQAAARQAHSLSTIRLTTSVVEFASTVMDLSVVLDNPLSMESQVTAVCRSCFCQLWQLRVVQRSFATDILQSLIQAFIHWQMTRLQAVQNAAAHLVSGAHRRDHAMPLLRNLHWLPVVQRVIFKVQTAVLVWKCMMYPWRCSSLPAKAMHWSEQHPYPWSSQTTLCPLAAPSYQGCKRLVPSGALLTMGRQCGTVCQQHCQTVACHYTHSSGDWTSAAWWTPSGAVAAFLRVWRRYIKLVTYLLTVEFLKAC